MKQIELQVDKHEHKMRLEDFLFERFGGLSRMYLREIVKNDKCEVNGRFENKGFRVRAGDFTEIELDLSRETAMRPQEMPLDIVYEDADLIVVNKAAGMLVHPTHRDKSGTLLNALAFYLNADCGMRIADSVQDRSDVSFAAASIDSTANKGDSAIRIPQFAFIRPGLIHRLDKQTSGLMVIAKNVRVHRILAGHFRKKLVEKKYLALVEGVIGDDEGIINAPIGRFAEQKHWGVKEDGKLAETRFRVRERFAETTLLELEPVTGRTNQLRIHCASIGHPIVGDTKRGGREFKRLCLHAYRLAFVHPETKERMTFEIEIPSEMRDKT